MGKKKKKGGGGRALKKEDQNQVIANNYIISYTIYIKRDNESAHKKGEKLDLAASDRNALF